MRSKLLAPLCLALLAAACGSSTPAATSRGDSELHALGEREVLADLEQVGDALRAYYGPLAYKKQRFGFDLDHELDVARASIHAGQTEGDRLRAIYVLLGHLHDLHVSLQPGVASDNAFNATLPFSLTNAGEQYVVASVATGAGGIAYGDVLVSIDGMSISQLEASLGTLMDYDVKEVTRARFAGFLTNRPSYVPTELLPRGLGASIGVEHADGTTEIVDVPWGRSKNVAEKVADLLASAAAAAHPAVTRAGVTAMSPEMLSSLVVAADASPDAPAFGKQPPFFATPNVASAFGWVTVTPSTIPDGASGLGAVKYAHGGKTILLVRIPTFLPPDEDANVDWLRTLLADAKTGAADDPDVAKRPADVVIVDETHNGGGSPDYAAGVASLFLRQPIPAQVQAFHADREWLASMQSETLDPSLSSVGVHFFADRTKELETAIDVGATLTPMKRAPGVSLGADLAPGDEQYGPTLFPHPKGTWTGPVLVLTDERSASAADLFPLLITNGGVGKTFGGRPGGAGGMVTDLVQLTSSGARFFTTLGLFGVIPPGGGDVHLVENQGVLPDYPRPLTVTDVRNRYVDYVKDFSDVAVALTRP